MLIAHLFLQLKCSAKGNTKPQYRWMKDGRFVSNWNDFGDYVMEHVTEEHQGGYSCLSSSSAGLLQSSVAYITVNGEKKFLVAFICTCVLIGSNESNEGLAFIAGIYILGLQMAHKCKIKGETLTLTFAWSVF